MNLLLKTFRQVYKYMLLTLCFVLCNTATFAFDFSRFSQSNDSTISADSLKAAQFYAIAQSEENTDSAIVSFNQAAELYAKHQLWPTLLECTIELGGKLTQLQKHDEAIKLMETVSEDYPETIESPGEQVATFHFLLGQNYTAIGNYYEALSHNLLSKSIKEHILGENHPGLSQNYSTLSFLYSSLSQPGKALEYGRKNLATVEAMDTPVLLSRAYHFIGNIYHQMQEYGRAVTYFKKAISVINNMEQPDQSSLIRTYINLGTSYIYLEDFDRSIYYLQEALSGAKRLGNKYFESAVLSNLGNVYLSSNQYKKALESNKLALEKLQEMFGAFHPSLGTPYHNIGKVYLTMGNYDQAELFYQKALNIDTTFYGQVHAYPAETYSGLGNIYEAKGDYDQALSFYQQSISALTLTDSSINVHGHNPIAFNEIADNFILLETLTYKANTLTKQYRQTSNPDKLERALETYILCTLVQDYTRKHLSNEDTKTLFAAHYSDFFEKAIQTSYQLYKIKGDDKYLFKAVNFIEQNKAHSLIESLTNAAVEGQSDSLLQNENSYKAKVAYLERMVFEEKAKKQQIDQEQIKIWQAEVFELNQELESVLEQIKKVYPQYHKAKYSVNNIDIKALQNEILAKNDLLLDFYVGDSSFYVFSATKNDYHLNKITIEENLKNKVESFINQLKKNNHAANADQAYELYKVILEETVNYYKETNIDHLIIIPDGILCYMPFDVLMETPAEGQGFNGLSFLFKRYNISYQYSAELLSINASEPTKSKQRYPFIGYAPEFSKKSNPLLATRSASDSLLVGQLSQLPLAEKEVKVIAGMLEGEYNTGNDATEEHFKEQASQADILHLASHTIIDNENPMYSKLVFSPDQDTIEDGLLHTYELYNMQLKADLVCLSACNTGVGKYYEGEGVMSLARGFMYAGVPNVVTSLWSVPDKSTSEIMTSFYSHMKAGMGKAEALRQAKLDYLANADEITSAPYYWAGFIYIGNNAANEETDYFWVALLAAVLVVAGLIFVVAKRKKNLLSYEH